ncbi:hypothetical protein AKO1_015857 [Acrasis kona]|uniref:Pentatricopeptide repeat-containing protein n=1 Tax=Acrasis kona TaxID=1008807 RepID=A0AAW2ZH00_9EUKA
MMMRCIRSCHFRLFTPNQIKGKLPVFTNQKRFHPKTPNSQATNQEFLYRILRKDHHEHDSLELFEDRSGDDVTNINNYLCTEYLPNLVKQRKSIPLRYMLDAYKTNDRFRELCPEVGAMLISGLIKVFVDSNNINRAIRTFKVEVLMCNGEETSTSGRVRCALPTENDIHVFDDMELLNYILESSLKYNALSPEIALNRTINLYKQISSCPDNLLLLPTTQIINTLIAGCAKLGLHERAMNFYKNELIGALNLRPTLDTFGQLIRAYATNICNIVYSGNINFLTNQFDKAYDFIVKEMNKYEIKPNPIFTNYAIMSFSALNQQDEVSKVLVLYKRSFGFEANHYTLDFMLNGLTKSTNPNHNEVMAQAKQILLTMASTGMSPTIYSYNIMLTGYTKRALIDDAVDFFYANMLPTVHSVESNILPFIAADSVSFNILIGALYRYQQIERIRQLRDTLVINKLDQYVRYLDEVKY